MPPRLRRTMTPLGALVRGMVSGAVGTAAMDAVWYWRYRRGGGKDRVLDWEFSAGVTGWDKASAPAAIGKRVVEGFTGRALPPERAALMNNVVHWAYGLTGGAAYGILVGSLRRRSLLLGLPFGAAVWATGYAVLPESGVYKPFWEYDPKTLWK